ncbi:beta-phosphoglucomutase [Paenibacillus jilunlii]|uniref:Beta-phosphoglucomutase n=1 Tax=Paenibacillus jilunlii TaxID=682956 RepID=A0A1G9P8R8_9BACL|nr:beta-phosphoglucomutase [Paenibacillus jilunlii]
MAEQKNRLYVDYISRLDDSELLPGVREYLGRLKEQGVGIALGSASKNAVFILDKLKLSGLFDAVVDGNTVSRAKPDPEVFETACRSLGLQPADCVVFEDAEAGIAAAKAAGMRGWLASASRRYWKQPTLSSQDCMNCRTLVDLLQEKKAISCMK